MRARLTNAFLLPTVAIMLLFIFIPCSLFAAGTLNCLKCHKKLAKGKFVHQAVGMGCPTCHTGIDGRTTPHRKTNTLSHGLSMEQPDLCYGCHDQAMFTRKDVHPAVGMGCTGCHDPHASKNAKLLKTKVPALCFSCHDKTGFSAKNVHPPVASGECLTCHNPHASDEIALLLQKPVSVCLSCHTNIMHWPHNSRGDARAPEPLDPLRPGKPFYCGSCHDPHSSDAPLLFRWNVRLPRELCLHCHKVN